MVQNVCAMTGSVESSRQNNNDLSLSSNKWTSCHVERVWMATASHLLNFIAGLLQNDLKGFVGREAKRFAGDGTRIWLSNQRTQKLLDWRKKNGVQLPNTILLMCCRCILWELETNSRDIKCSRNQNSSPQIYTFSEYQLEVETKQKTKQINLLIASCSTSIWTILNPMKLQFQCKHTHIYIYILNIYIFTTMCMNICIYTTIYNCAQKSIREKHVLYQTSPPPSWPELVAALPGQYLSDGSNPANHLGWC